MNPLPPLPPILPVPGAGQLVLHQVIDRQHGNVVAWVFEHPADWQARSHVAWSFEHPSLPVISYAAAFNPAGLEAVEFFPVEMFFWVEPSYGFYQPGQIVQGQAALPPMPAADALARWVIPRYRGQRPGLRIAGIDRVPPLGPRIGFNPPGGSGEDVCARLEYPENGRTVEEELYGVKISVNVPYYGPQGAMMQTNWGFARLFSFRAEKGALDGRRELFWRIAGSARANPLWEQLYGQILQKLKAEFDQYLQAGYSQIQAAAQLSRSISANNDAMLSLFAQQRQAAWQSDAARRDSSGSSSTDAFSDSIRGVETVADPYYGESKQDSNYQYHWTDGFGSYRHSNDPFFNPNIGSNQSWTLMPKKT